MFCISVELVVVVDPSQNSFDNMAVNICIFINLAVFSAVVLTDIYNLEIQRGVGTTFR